MPSGSPAFAAHDKQVAFRECDVFPSSRACGAPVALRRRRTCDITSVVPITVPGRNPKGPSDCCRHPSVTADCPHSRRASSHFCAHGRPVIPPAFATRGISRRRRRFPRPVFTLLPVVRTSTCPAPSESKSSSGSPSALAASVKRARARRTNNANPATDRSLALWAVRVATSRARTSPVSKGGACRVMPFLS